MWSSQIGLLISCLWLSLMPSWFNKSQIHVPTKHYLFCLWLWSLKLTVKVAMKLKNIVPDKIWAKSDHWFKSYGWKNALAPRNKFYPKVRNSRLKSLANFKPQNCCQTFEPELEDHNYICHTKGPPIKITTVPLFNRASDRARGTPPALTDLIWLAGFQKDFTLRLQEVIPTSIFW